MILKFRVISDEIETFLRVIEISETDTFESLHNILKQTCEFDDSQMASFNISNSDWEKLDEICMFDMGNEESPSMIMNETIIGNNISSVDDTLIYNFDFFGDRALYLTLTEIKDPEGVIQYPICSHKVGDAPKIMPNTEDEFDDIYEDFEDEYDEDFDAFDSGEFEEFNEDSIY